MRQERGAEHFLLAPGRLVRYVEWQIAVRWSGVRGWTRRHAWARSLGSGRRGWCDGRWAARRRSDLGPRRERRYWCARTAAPRCRVVHGQSYDCSGWRRARTWRKGHRGYERGALGERKGRGRARLRGGLHQRCFSCRRIGGRRLGPQVLRGCGQRRRSDRRRTRCDGTGEARWSMTAERAACRVEPSEDREGAEERGRKDEDCTARQDGPGHLVHGRDRWVRRGVEIRRLGRLGSECRRPDERRFGVRAIPINELAGDAKSSRAGRRRCGGGARRPDGHLRFLT